MLLVPVFIFLAYKGTEPPRVGAFVVFLTASLSDFLDGYLARRRGSITRAGKFLDPLADKILVGAALWILVDTTDFPWWAALVIAVREAAVQALRTGLVKRGIDMPASTSAKAKTLVQIVMISVWLLPVEVSPVHWTLLVAAVALTLWSGLEYFMVALRPREVAR